MEKTWWSLLPLLPLTPPPLTPPPEDGLRPKIRVNSTLLRHLLLVFFSSGRLLQVSLFISSFIIGLKVTYASIEAY